MTAHDHGNCKLCDQLEATLARVIAERDVLNHIVSVAAEKAQQAKEHDCGVEQEKAVNQRVLIMALPRYDCEPYVTVRLADVLAVINYQREGRQSEIT